MKWTPVVLIVLAAAVFAAPSPVSSGIVAAVDPAAVYAAREAGAADLEQFTGGWHGVVLTVLLVGLVVWLVYELCYHDHIHESAPAPSRPTPRP